MENNNQNTELELMRSQMEDFKAQLDKQKIVNEKMITLIPQHYNLTLFISS